MWIMLDWDMSLLIRIKITMLIILQVKIRFEFYLIWFVQSPCFVQVSNISFIIIAEFQSPGEVLPYVYCPPPNYGSPYNPYNPFIPGALIEPPPPYVSSGSYPCYPSFAQPGYDVSNTSPLVNTRGLLATVPCNADASRYYPHTPVDSSFSASFKPFYPSKSIDKVQNFLSPAKPAAFHRSPSQVCIKILQL